MLRWAVLLACTSMTTAVACTPVLKTELTPRDWIATIPSWPHTFRYRPMREVALELSKELRDPKGEHRVDIIIALTHCRVPNVSACATKLTAGHQACERARCCGWCRR